MTKITRALALALVTTLTLFASDSLFGQSAKTSLKDPALAARFNKVSDRLTCQCGCQEGLRVCSHQNCPSATPMRQEIESQLLAGATDDAIVASFVAKEGNKVLSEPPATGFNLSAYVMPGFILLIGLFIVAAFASRWSNKRKLAPAPAGPVDAEVKARIEKELKSE